MLATDLSSSHLQERVKKRFTSIGRCQEKAKVRRGAVDLGQEKTSAPTLSEWFLAMTRFLPSRLSRPPFLQPKLVTMLWQVSWRA